jgi:sarcosine oxidase
MPRVAIVGAGIVGAATAWALARRGVEVELHEQFEPGHSRGSSHGRSRIWRLAYPEPEWVALAREGVRGWRELESEAGQQLLVTTGLLELAESEELGSRDALEAAGIAAEPLGPAAVEARFGVRIKPRWSCLFQPEAGYVLADRALAAFLDCAARRGTRLETGRRVDPDELEADAVVVTAGPWAPTLLAGHGIELPVTTTRETVVYFDLGRPVPSMLEIARSDRAFDMYALVDPVHGLKVGCHRSGTGADPDEEGGPDPEIVARIVEWTRERVPDLGLDPAGVDTCFYTSTDDGRFLLERHGRVVVGSACSGHAFKFAPALGERLADLATGAVG